MSALMNYDTGPLNWVRGDIETALQAAIGRLQAYASDSSLSNALRLAGEDAHQVSGALRMVGLEGAATLARTLQDCLAAAASEETPPSPDMLRAMRNGFEGLSRWVKNMADGRGSGELALFPLYKRLRELQGAERVFEGELFFPDLRTRIHGKPSAEAPSAEELAARVKAARSVFQRGLLAFLRGSGATEGLRRMRDALAEIEQIAPSQASRTFWWACVGFVESLIANGVEADFHVKQLLARVDLQMRRLMEGSPQVAERLLRDALFFVAKSQTVEGRAAEVRNTFGLDRYLPGKDLLDPEALARLRPVMDALKAGFKLARDLWHAQVEGAGDKIDDFCAQLDRMHPQARMLEGSGLEPLLRQLAAAAAATQKHQGEAREALDLEIAATLLFLQNAVDTEDIVNADFAGRAQKQEARLVALSEGRAAPLAADHDSVERRAAERDMLLHLAHEVSQNLKQMEESLDAFFRDPAQREGLSQLPALASQAQGALAMLELNDAARLLGAATEAIGAYAADGVPDAAAQGRVADAFSSLGLFIESHCAGRADALEILRPVLVDFGLMTELMTEAEAEDTVEAGLGRRKLDVKSAYLAWRDEAPGSDDFKKKFLETLTELGRDAELIDDEALLQACRSALESAQPERFPASALDVAIESLTGASLPPRSEPVILEFAVPASEPEVGQPSTSEFSPESLVLAGDTESADTYRAVIETAQPAYGAVVEFARPTWGAVIEHAHPVWHAEVEYAQPSAPGIVEAEPAESGSFPGATRIAEVVAEPIDSRILSVIPEGTEPELLEIFLEEACEVLASLQQAVDACRRSPEDADSLTVIRRGFHTLKGSGRMVGLNDLGEAAWGMEQLMNGWLAESKPGTDDLMNLVEMAGGLFQQWVDALKSGSVVELAVSPLQDAAERVGRGESPQAPVVAAATSETAVDMERPAQVEAVVAEVEVEPAMDAALAMADSESPDETALELVAEFIETAVVTATENEDASHEVDGAAFESFAAAAEESEIHFDLDAADAPELEVPAPKSAWEEATFEDAMAEITRSELPEFESEDATFEDAKAEITPPEAPEFESGFFEDAIAEPHAFDAEAEMLETPVSEEAHAVVVAFEAPVGEADEPAEAGSVMPEAAPIEPEGVVVAEADVNADADATEPAAEGSDELVIGDVAVSAALYEIFIAEAQLHLATLRHEQQRLADMPENPVTEAARRAVHTLAGIAGTAGFGVLADLAHALELYWNRFGHGVLPASHIALVHEAIDRLHVMVEAILGSEAPAAASDLIATLGELEDEQRESSVRHAAEAQVAAETDAEVVTEAEVSAEEPAAEATGMHADESAPLAEPALPDVRELITEFKPAPQVPVFERREVADEVDEQLLPIFLEETETLVPDTSAQLRAWRASPGDVAARDALRRSLHTLKGSARMAGAMRLGELTHVMESRVIAVIEEQIAADADVFDKLEAEFDRLSDSVERLKHGESAANEAAQELPQPVAAPVEPIFETPLVVRAEEGHGQEAHVAQPINRESQALTLRVRADWVDRMVNQAGEVAIARSRIESELFAFKRHVAELSEALVRLRSHIREVEIQAESQMQATFQSHGHAEHFDPLEFDRFTRFQEVTRFLAESVNDISTVQHILLARLGEADAALIQQTRLNRELQQNLLRVRMVPLYSVAERLYRTVRQTARDVGKRAQLDIRGGELEIDRSVLEKVTAPIEHLLRNALAHGIEAPEVRHAAGKPEFGEITLSAHQSGNEMVLTVKDDGRGLDFARIRQKAEALGLLTAGIEPSEKLLAQMIFAAGFSTAETVSQVAGRGVGMDVVKSEISALGGRIDITSTEGTGTSFNIYLPLTLAMTQAVMIEAARQEYALPASLVQQVVELAPEALASAMAAGEIEWRGERYPLTYLPRLLGDAEAVHEVQRYNPVILLRSGSSQAAILVDVVSGTREIVVKNIGPQIARVSGIAGATVRGDGRVVLILNPVPLALRWVSQPQATTRVPSPVPAVQANEAPLVLVVDDSLTVRKITTRLLTREGFRVESAKDGVDALEKMNDLVPDVVLLDVEMPRMDGFELARVMRNEEHLKRVPIIMITSRTADKHRTHAMEIGVDVYLGKPYQEQQLLDHIAEQLEARAAIAG